MRALLTRIYSACCARRNQLRTIMHGRAIHAAHDYMHLAYFAAVSVEAHGFYGMAAGALFAFGMLSAMLGEVDI